jgi:hypothetical protein
MGGIALPLHACVHILPHVWDVNSEATFLIRIYVKFEIGEEAWSACLQTVEMHAAGIQWRRNQPRGTGNY